MNNIKEFLKDKVSAITEEFNNIKASVYFECLNSAYYVQIQPSEFFKNSMELKKFRRAIQDEFYNTYFDATLTFLDKDSLLELEKFDYVLQGDSYINELYFAFTISDIKLNNEIKTNTLFEVLTDSDNDYAIAA